MALATSDHAQPTLMPAHLFSSSHKAVEPPKSEIDMAPMLTQAAQIVSRPTALLPGSFHHASKVFSTAAAQAQAAQNSPIHIANVRNRFFNAGGSFDNCFFTCDRSTTTR